MLSPYRVLDLTDERGIICGQILADLGADVIAIEPPGGSPARRLGPFAGDTPDPERSLFWWAYGRNKRSVTLDLETEGGRSDLRRLIEGAHFFIESEAPGVMAARGFGFDDVAKTNPGIVYVSITPFGQDGPKAQYAATDITIYAAGGPLVLNGDDDRAPVRVTVPQAYLHAGAEAALAALVAHHERVRSGRGQHVDVSAQQAVAQATLSSVLAAPFNAQPFSRLAGGLKFGPLLLRWVYPTMDGHVAITFLFGTAVGPFTRRLMEFIYEEGFCDEATRDIDWIGIGAVALSEPEKQAAELDRVQNTIERFTHSKTKAELLAAALERGLLIAPITRIDEVVASEHLAARGYWRDLEVGGRPVRYPGPSVRCSETPIAYRLPAPQIGEHNEEILAAAAPAPAPAVRGGSNGAAPEAALAGVKILDFQWVMAGPAATRALADYGATVVRVESTKRIDTARTVGPMRNGVFNPDQSGMFINLNTGKLGLTMDCARPEGRAVILDLVRWADVVIESFSPKAMRAWGLDYASLRNVKPDIIMLSTCLMGQDGPMSRFAGYGNLAAAISGFFNLTGWPDRLPAGPFSAYTDTVAPRFTAAALLAALDHRARTGQGQYIDQSQAESALHFLAPAILDYTVNGLVMERAGNADRDMAPHGVYPAAGDDRWVAIAVAGDAQWAALCDVIGHAELARDQRYATAAARLARRDELDALVSEWTRARPERDVEAALQARGIAAYAVQDSAAMLSDPQLKHRGHFVRLDDGAGGTQTVEGSRFRLSRTPAKVDRPAPTFGRDNFYVLETILGYDADRIAELATAGVLE